LPRDISSIVLLNQYYAPDEAATAQMLADLGESLSDLYDVRAICSERSYADPARRYPRYEMINGVTIDRVRSSGFGRSSHLGRAIDYLRYLIGVSWRLLVRQKPAVAIVLTTPPMLSFVVCILSKIRGFAVVFWSMDIYPELAIQLGVLSKRSWTVRLLTRLSSYVLRNATVVVALGPAMAEHLAARGARRVEIIHNWADEKAIVPIDSTCNEDPPSRSSQRPFEVMYSGNLGLAHEFQTILAGARRLESVDPQIRITFIGGGPRLREVTAAATNLSNVSFRGYEARSDLGRSLASADVHLVTLRPGMVGLLVPSKIYGILAAGRPTIYVGPPTGDVYQIIHEAQCGSTIVNGDVDAFVAAVTIYRADPLRLRTEGQRARAFFEAHFTRTLAVDRFEKIIASI
jgi:colanic acid biosynthesis glycosyl transferase WcaI